MMGVSTPNETQVGSLMCEDIPLPCVSQQVLDFLSHYDSYMIIGHREPDGDCVCSCLALSSFLKRHGKKVFLLSAGPFAKTEVVPYQSLFTDELPDVDKSSTGLVVLDCAGIDRVGKSLSPLLVGFPTAIIDHHATNAATDDSQSNLILKNSPSTTYLVQSIIEAVDGSVSKEEAHLLFLGLACDTGFFRHLDGRSANVFLAASRLIAAGANPKKVFAEMNGGKSIASRLILSRILSRMQTFYDGRLVVSYETYDDVQEFGTYSRDSDTTYMVIQSIANVEAIVLLRQESMTHCSIGFRSLDRIDVSRVAKEFGGGGHIQASGAYKEGTVQELIPLIVKAFDSDFM